MIADISMSILFVTEHHLYWRSSRTTSDDPVAALKAGHPAAAIAADIKDCLLLCRQRLVLLQLQQQLMHMYARMPQQET